MRLHAAFHCFRHHSIGKIDGNFASNPKPDPYLKTWSEIVAGCLRGEHTAQRMAYASGWRVIYPAVYAILQNKEEAEDAMQESIIKGFERLAELKEPEKYLGWQKRISVRYALMQLRQRKSVTQLFPDLPEQPDWYEDNAFLNIEVKRVHYQLRKMPEGYRLVIQLHLLEGMSHEEIGQALGIAASTSRSQYSRGIAYLRTELLAEYEKQI